MLLFGLIEIVSLNSGFASCFSSEWIGLALPTVSKLKFVLIHNFYANVVVCFSLLMNIVGILLVFYYEKYYYDADKAFAAFKDANPIIIAGFLTQYQSLISIVIIGFVAVFIIALRSSKKEIYRISLNETQESIPKTIRSDGLSVVLNNNSTITLDLSSDELDFLYGSVVIFGQVNKTVKLYLESEIKNIMINGVGINKEIVFDSIRKEWYVNDVTP